MRVGTKDMAAVAAGAVDGVLVVGWKAKAIQALTRHGIPVTSVVAPDEAAKCRKLGLGRTLVAADPTRAEDVAAALARNGCSAADFQVVCSPQELTVLTAALVGAAAGNSAIGLSASLALRDKAVQKAAVRAAGVPVAACHVVTHTAEVAQVAAERPVVVKPLSGAGSADTYRVDTTEAGSALAERLAGQGLQGPWLVEEFVDGVEMQVDGVVRAGELLFLSISRYLDNLIHIHDGAPVGAAALAPSVHRALYDQAQQLTRDALAAIGLVDGVFHLEIFTSPEGIVFSECGGRVGGALTDEMLRHRFGVDIYDEWARAVLALPSALSTPRSDPGDSVGYVHLTTRPGRVVSVPTHEELTARPGVLHAELDIHVGDIVEDLTVSSHLRAARVVVRGASDLSVAEDLRSLSQWFQEATVIDPMS
jgi:biotin carboxylase